MIPIENAPKLAERVWAQENLPVVFLPERGQIAIKLPNDESTRTWLQGDGRLRPKWDPEGEYWIIPAAWYERILKLSLERFGAVYTVRPGWGAGDCAWNCMHAKGPDCKCACRGRNHGCAVNPEIRWNEIKESLAVPWGSEGLRCSLLVPPKGKASRRTASRAARLISDYR